MQKLGAIHECSFVFNVACEASFHYNHNVITTDIPFVFTLHPKLRAEFFPHKYSLGMPSKLLFAVSAILFSPGNLDASFIAHRASIKPA